MKTTRKTIAFGMVGVLCCSLLSGCFREKPEKLLDTALNRWQEAIVQNDMSTVWTELFTIQPQWSSDTKNSFQEETEWYTAESAAFDGTMLEPYVEQARKSVVLHVTDRKTVNIQGVQMDVASVEIKGDRLGRAICDWLLAAREQLPDNLLQNPYDYIDSKIIADTMNGNDTVYGQAGIKTFENFGSYYKACQGEFRAEVELTATWIDDDVYYECSGDSDAIKDAFCGLIHLDGPVDDEQARYIDMGYSINLDDLKICYSDVMQQNYWQVFRFPEEE